jgi:O-antigen/teichoic acid export membrane protein
MTDSNKLLKQSSQYFFGQIVVMAAGFLSFPILTRIFSIENYGVLGIATTTIMLATAIAKVGSTNSTVRFFPEHKNNGTLSIYYSTMIFGYAGIAIVVALLLCIVSFCVNMYGDTSVKLIAAISLLVVLMSLYSVMQGMLRAEQKIKNYIITNVFFRYGTISLGVLALFFVYKSVEVYLTVQALVLLVILAVVFIGLHKKHAINPGKFSVDLFRNSISYGFFLSMSEIGHLVLSYADRYLIQYILGAAALGVYTAGYNLSTYIVEVLMYPVNNAIDPIYLNIHATKGEEDTRLFLSKAFKYYFIFMLVTVVAFIAVGKELIILLASAKYATAYQIIPYVVTANAIYSFQVIINAGLIINKKTSVLMKLKFISCAINIVLNIILIPINGIAGAAQATLLSYVIYLMLVKHYSFKELRFEICTIALIKYLLFAFALFEITRKISFESYLINIPAKLITVLVSFTVFTLLMEKEVRAAAVASYKVRFSRG